MKSLSQHIIESLNESTVTILDQFESIFSTVSKRHHMNDEILNFYHDEFVKLLTGQTKELLSKMSPSYSSYQRIQGGYSAVRKFFIDLDKSLESAKLIKTVNYEYHEDDFGGPTWEILASKIHKEKKLSQFESEVKELQQGFGLDMTEKEFNEYLNDYYDRPEDYNIDQKSLYFTAIMNARHNVKKYFNAYKKQKV